MLEADARIIIDTLLRASGWGLPGDDGVVNVDMEKRHRAGVADYLLKDSSDLPLCIIEAKKELIHPLVGKEQARRYAESLHCRFVILSNGVAHYLWDLQHGSPAVVGAFPSQEQLELRQTHFNPPQHESENIGADYIALTQCPHFDQHPEYIDEKRRDAFVRRNALRFLREYQLRAVKAIRSRVAEGQDKFLLEMATGTGKTLTSAAIIKMFLRLYHVKRVLFLVDRLELEAQAQKEFQNLLKNDYRTVLWKKKQQDWTQAEIVVSTVQGLMSGNTYRKLFRPDAFDLVISDEAHRSMGARSRKVFEYFIGFKLGLTATPKSYLTSVQYEDMIEKAPRQLEERLMRDTYATFGCEEGEPTFRYSLEEGVKDGHLIKPKVMDARTGITTELLSEQGYVVQSMDEDGHDVEETFTQKSFEKRFFSENTNTIFCETVLKEAMRDPYTGDIGKTLVFCVSQNHAAKVTHIFNVLADKIFPQRYTSDFAVQVTSSVQDAQRMTIDFRNNSLKGHTNPHYRTSKTRICVTVGMMTTGYDCADILNIVMMRPVYSPSEFIQMKGRGTRTCDFSHGWITRSEIPDHVDPQKRQFLLFDFFRNYDYFEKEFDYDKVLKLPSKPTITLSSEPLNLSKVVSTAPDSLLKLREIFISAQGMKVDRYLYSAFKKKILQDSVLRDMVRRQTFDKAALYLKEKVLNKPHEFFTMGTLRKALGLDRRLTVPELLLYVFDYIGHIPSQRERLEEAFDTFDQVFDVEEAIYRSAKEVFEAYAADHSFREIIDGKRYAELGVHPSGEAFRQLPPSLRNMIPSYIKQHVHNIETC